MDVDRAQVLEQYRQKIREHREVEARCVLTKPKERLLCVSLVLL